MPAEVLAFRRLPAAPYVAFEAFRALLAAFAAAGIPRRIDHRDIPQSSTVVASQLLTTLRFLGLVDEMNAPTPAMAEITGALGTDRWPGQLAQLVQRAYGPMLREDLGAADLREFQERFGAAYPAAANVQRKSRAFFLRAAEEAGISISRDIRRSIKPRSSAGSRNEGARGGQMQVQDDPNGVVTQSQRAAANNQLKVSSLILNSFYDFHRLTDAEQTAVLTTIRLLKVRGR